MVLLRALPGSSSSHVPATPATAGFPLDGAVFKDGPLGNGLDLGIHRRDLVGMLPNPPKSCSIPLLEVPVDGNYDQGIRLPHSMRSGSSGDPKMAVPPPAPVCENQPAPGPRLKAK